MVLAEAVEGVEHFDSHEDGEGDGGGLGGVVVGKDFAADFGEESRTFMEVHLVKVGKNGGKVRKKDEKRKEK